MDLQGLNEKGLRKYIDLDKWGISIFVLKMIAVVTMLLDHFAIIFCRGTSHTVLYYCLRILGRLSFPIFCFVLVEGFFYTRNKLSHAIRLGIFAFISEVPYDMMYKSFFDMSHQNAIFTLFFGFMVIWGLDEISKQSFNYPKFLSDRYKRNTLNAIFELIIMAVGLGSVWILNSSYSYGGVCLIMCLYVFRVHKIGRCISNLVFNMGFYGYGIQWFGVISAIPIAFYNGKKGRVGWKYFFYWFYPVHILLLVILRIIYIRYVK